MNILVRYIFPQFSSLLSWERAFHSTWISATESNATWHNTTLTVNPLLLQETRSTVGHRKQMTHVQDTRCASSWNYYTSYYWLRGKWTCVLNFLGLSIDGDFCIHVMPGKGYRGNAANQDSVSLKQSQNFHPSSFYFKMKQTVHQDRPLPTSTPWNRSTFGQMKWSLAHRLLFIDCCVS